MSVCSGSPCIYFLSYISPCIYVSYFLGRRFRLKAIQKYLTHALCHYSSTIIVSPKLKMPANTKSVSSQKSVGIHRDTEYCSLARSLHNFKQLAFPPHATFQTESSYRTTQPLLQFFS